MLTRFFNNTRPITLLILFLFLAIISLSSIYSYYNNIEFHNFYAIQDNYQFFGKFFHIVLSIFLTLAFGLFVHIIVHKNSITRDNSYAFLFFVLLFASHPALPILNPVLAGAFFVVLALQNLLSLHEHTAMTSKLFNAGLLIGIASVIYPYAILYGILIYLGIIIYGADSWRKWFMPIIGILIPYYILFAWYFWFDELDIYWERYFIKSFNFSLSDFYQSKETLIVWGIYSLLTIFSIFDYISNMSSHKLDTRKGYSMTYGAFFIGVIITMSGTIKNGQELIILFFPLSIIWAKFVQHQKKEKWKTIFILVAVINVILSYIITKNGG